MIATTQATVTAVLAPEAVLAGGLVATLIADMVLPVTRRGILGAIAFASCVAALGVSLIAAGGELEAMATSDGIALLARATIYAVTGLVILTRHRDGRLDPEHGAWLVCVLGLALGSSCAALANNLVSLWFGLEIASLAGYVLAAWSAGDRRAAEAGMKYALFGGVASALMLFGASHVYGMTGSLDFAGIGHVLGDAPSAAIVAAVCLTGAGIAYKLAIVPLHAWAPDVYEGAPALSAALVGIVPKVGAVAALVRCLSATLPEDRSPSIALAAALSALAVASLVVAAFTALAQRDAKRVLALSGIGHAGAMLLALAAHPGQAATAAAAYYLLTYAVANLGAFVCLAEFERERGSCSFQALAGALRQRPVLTTLLAGFVLSLAGLPPLAGFLAKWGVLRIALERGMADDGRTFLVWAGVAMIGSAALAAWSYLLILRAALFGARDEVAGQDPRPMASGTRIVLGLCMAATLVLGLWLDGFARIADVLSIR